MILITLGSSQFEFQRLLKIIENLCQKDFFGNNEIIAQIGYTKFNSKYFECFEMVNSSKFNELIDKSDIIITHAGVGTISNALKKSKKIIVFPRLVDYDEHVDNHQLEIAEMFYKNNFILKAENEKQLIEAFNSIDSFNPEKFISNNLTINKKIIDYIEGV